MPGEYLQYGGQAIIEGVMMRSPKFFSVACRAPNGQIVLRTEAIEKTWIGRQKWLKIPFLRGSLAILDSMALGLRSMRFASNVQLDEDLQAPVPEDAETDESKPADRAAPPKQPSQKMQDGLILGTMIFAVVLGLFLFQYLPNFISAAIAGNRNVVVTAKANIVDIQGIEDRLKAANVTGAKVVANEAGRLEISAPLMGKLKGLKQGEAPRRLLELGGLRPADIEKSEVRGMRDWMINLLTEIIKFSFFIGYIWMISRMKEIQRVFQFHGAEHKAINTLEREQELTIENCKAQTRLHPRCGTSFAVIVLILSLIVLTFVPRPQEMTWLVTSVIRFLIEVPLLLVLAGISYELIRIAGKFRDQRWVSYIFWPGLMTQYITTSEPDEDQIVVALESLKATVAAEKSGGAPADTVILGTPMPVGASA